MVLLKVFFEKVDFENLQQMTKNSEKLHRRQRVNTLSEQTVKALARLLICADFCIYNQYGSNPSLVLVQPRKTGPYITERLLMGRKESNQTK